MGVTSAPVQVGDAQCAFGGSRFTSANATTYACNGAKGDQGPAGQAAVTGSLVGPVMTSSSTQVDLGFPTVNVPLGPTGVVEIWATATMSSSTAGGSAIVGMVGPVGTQLLSSTGTTQATMYTLPASHTGTTDRLSGMILIGPVGGSMTSFKLEFNAAGGGTATFSNVQLVAIPL